MTTEQVATYTGLPQSTIRHWLWKRQFPASFPAPTRLGRRLLWDRRAVEKWVDGKLAEAQDEFNNKGEDARPSAP
jgi:excisionase family DNA binding protein